MSKNRKQSNKEAANKDYIKDQLLALLYANQPKDFSHKQITKKLGLRDKKSRQALSEILDKLANSGEVQQMKNGNFKSEEGEANYIVGTVDHVNPRFAFIVSAETEVDVRVKTEDLHTALDGDKVKIIIYGKAKGDGRVEGEVVEILERKKEEFVGKIEMSPRYAFVVPDSRKIHFDIFVKLENLNGAKNKDKVIARITEWPSSKRKGNDENPMGEVIAVLGPAGDNEAEIHSIMAEFGLPFSFPEQIENIANKISTKITKAEISKRRDMRGATTFTIDPADAKDFDDALSLELLDNGNYEIGIHISDVSHYVKPETALDGEAFDRATSVYLVDRTIPMLPEKLSNDLCSLRPNEDKLTFSAVFEIDKNAHVVSQWFGRTIIHSDRRFSYEEAQERIETLEGDFAKENILLNELALKLRAARFMKGAINFETLEVKFRLDEKGKPLEVIPKVRKDAHKMIEEFMLLANKKVAEYIFGSTRGKGKKSKEVGNTFVYRIHDHPDPEKLNTFSVFAKKFGHSLKVEEKSIASSMNKLLEDIEGKPEQNVLEALAIRTMAKAKYTTEEKGHFGLAFDHYTHFTSPIRRYPDVMVHRLLQHYLDGGKSTDKQDYEEKCVHSSEMEKRAADAERASIKYKQVEFMQTMLNESFEGLVSGITEWGVFVEIIETKCEGMVRMSDMTDDYYEFDEKNYRIIGRRNKKIITLGDKVNVKVVKTDVDKRTIDLEFVKGK